ncbi:substrate-binding domain-containing protein [Geothrix sp.]|uniref:PstS family phosphate ABC transporter substrate-binding protein n=1 Tax=Geothrix sp. TaxID=1962974 RepID=UPI0025BADAD2|nr:substrate-binding domain-containing protein [Geothrix sp.]WIL22405.1 MAG: substrate-binding domain-containing protein [Geothrix sp.]
MRKTSAWTVLFLLCTAWSASAQVTDTIRVNGSGSAMSMLKPLAEAYQHSNRHVEIVAGKPLGSSGALKALLAGAIDIAVSSKPLSAEDSAKGARLFPYGKTPLALVAEKEVPATDLNSAQLEDIFAGRMTRWGQGPALRLVLRPEGDVDTQLLRGFSPAMNQAVSLAQARPGMLVAVTDPEATALISRTQGGFGVAGLASVLEDGFPLKVLTLNGISPTTAALAGGTYPLVKDIHIVIAGGTTPAAMAFITFIYSKQGRALAQKAGVWVTASATPAR